MIKVRVANPGPAALMVLNPKKRGEKMKARRSTRRRPRRSMSMSRAPRRIVHRHKSKNPTGARGFGTRRQRRRYLRAGYLRRMMATRRKVGNGVFTRISRIVGGSRRRRAKRNPSGMVGRGFALAAAAAVIQFGMMWIPPLGGVSALADAGRTAAVGWLSGIVMRKTGFFAKYADDFMLAGFTLAGGKVITAFVLPFAQRVFAGQQAAPAAGMKGLATWNPGMNPFPVYTPRPMAVGVQTPASTGMSGIATFAPGMQPFPIYTNSGTMPNVGW